MEEDQEKKTEKEEAIKFLQEENKKELENFQRELKELCEKYSQFELLPQQVISIVPKR